MLLEVLGALLMVSEIQDGNWEAGYAERWKKLHRSYRTPVLLTLLIKTDPQNV